MADTSSEMQALEEAIAKANGPTALAGLIGCKSSSAPINWRTRGRVPAEWCPAIERETGVACERLRPDVAWTVLRSQPGWGAKPNSEGN